MFHWYKIQFENSKKLFDPEEYPLLPFIFIGHQMYFIFYFCTEFNKMSGKRFYRFLLSIILFSCSPQKQESTLISGKFDELSGKWLFFEELDVKKMTVIDSVKIKSDGSFKFEPKVDEAGFYVLRTTKENYLILLLEQGEKAELFSKDSLFKSGYEVRNSPGSLLLKDFEKFMSVQKVRIDSLAEAFYQSKDSINFLGKKLELDSIFDLVFEDQQEYVREFINKNPGSLASLIVLNRKLGNNAVLDEEKDFIYFHRTDSALMVAHPTNKHILDHNNRVKEIRGRIFDRFTADDKLKPGQKAPNIVVRDTNDQMLSLKGLTGQKVVICFWAGWNAKSRKENRQMVEYYPDLRKKNIELFGVSLDENIVVWKGALKLDKLPGIQGSDLKGLESEVMKNYNLADDICYYYLIDEDQKIMYRSKEFKEMVSTIQELK